MSDYIDEPPEDPYESAPAVDALAETERRVIGGAMRYPRILSDLQRDVVGGDFNDQRLGTIFRGIADMAAAGEHIDYFTVADKLPSWQVRGIDLGTLSAWYDAATVGAATYAAPRVREASMRRELSVIGERLRDPGADVGVAIARSVEDLRTLRDASTTGKSVRWLREVMDVPEEEDAYDWVIPELLERKDRLMLSAGEGTGKTTLLRQLAICSAAGVHPTRFSRMDPVNVLVIDAENSERQWRRAARGLIEMSTMQGQRDPRDHLALHCVGVMDITTPAGIGQVHRWMDESKPDLVLLGPLYRVTPGALNDDDKAAPVLAALDSIRERDVAMLIEVHAGHARTTSGERELRPRGSSALLGWPEFGLGLRRNKVIDGKVPTFSLVRWRGDRDRREWPERMIRGQAWPWEPTA